MIHYLITSARFFFNNKRTPSKIIYVLISLQSTSESNLLSLFYPLLTNFENVFGRCNQNSTNFYNCTLNRYWNNTNQNGSKIKP